MFSQSAAWYDALYSFKDYAAEAAALAALLEEIHPEAETVLDVACGTAEHDRYLRRRYRVDGLDANPAFLDIAAAKNAVGRYAQGDMTDFDLGRRYDAVICLFSSIAYVKTIENVTRTLRCFARHLHEGGVVVVEPWLTPQTWRPDGKIHVLTGETAVGKICRMNLSQPAVREGERLLTVLDFHYLAGTAVGVAHFTERHEMGLFTVAEMKGAFRDAGFAVRYDEEGLTGRGLYVGH
jgi:SAM-dependent methyltransferase